MPFDIKISEDDFEKEAEQTQHAILFKGIVQINDKLDNQHERLSSLEARKFFNTTTSAASGLVGGFIAMLSKAFIFKG